MTQSSDCFLPTACMTILAFKFPAPVTATFPVGISP